MCLFKEMKFTVTSPFQASAENKPRQLEPKSQKPKSAPRTENRKAKTEHPNPKLETPRPQFQNLPTTYYLLPRTR